MSADTELLCKRVLVRLLDVSFEGFGDETCPPKIIACCVLGLLTAILDTTLVLSSFVVRRRRGLRRTEIKSVNSGTQDC